MLSLVKIYVLICKITCGSGLSVLTRQEENTESVTLSKIDYSQRRPSPNLFQVQYIKKRLLIQEESAHL